MKSMKKATVLSELKRKMKEHNYKFTNQRQIVLEVFIDSKHHHMSADDVYAMLQDEHPEIGLATVYRTLELFTELGILKKLDFEDGRFRYEINDHKLSHSHYHLICLKCGKVIEFSYDSLDKIQNKIKKENGFTIVDYNLKFYGYCKDCAEEMKAEKLKQKSR